MKRTWRTLMELFKVMPSGAKPFYFGYSIITGLLSILDTLALGLIVLTVTPMAAGGPVTLPFIGALPSSATPWLVISICALFILKGAFALALHWFATRRFARYELEVGDRLFSTYMHSSWERRSQLSTSDVTRIIDQSMANTTLGFLLQWAMIPGHLFTFLSVLIVLIVAQPVTAAIAFVYLSAISLVMVLVVAKKAGKAGATNRRYSYRAATVMTEMVEALKEVTLRGKLDVVGEIVSENRARATRARANNNFLAMVPKYSLEAALIGGFLLVGGVSYLMGGLASAMVSVALFAATGFRMIPALNGVQSGLASVAASEAYALDIIRELRQEPDDTVEETQDIQLLPESPKVLELRGVSFRYPGAEQKVLEAVSMEIPFGSTLAIVGPSGAGKSTLIDIILGLSVPSSGALYIDDIQLVNVLSQWRSRVGYVPQRVALFDSSIAQNVALTWKADYDPARVTRALKRAHLEEFLTRGEGIEALVGERGQAVSGGQQQRLGIARALYVDPLVMVMDEATSSLDTATESRVTESMRELHGEVTFITVAHRLATIREYDQVCYLDKGRILGRGTFDEVVEQVPEFKLQAQLAGLMQI